MHIYVLFSFVHTVCMYVCYYIYLFFKRGLLHGPLALLPPPRSRENVSPSSRQRRCLASNMFVFWHELSFFSLFFFSFSALLAVFDSFFRGLEECYSKKKKKKKKKLQCGGSIHLDIFPSPSQRDLSRTCAWKGSLRNHERDVLRLILSKWGLAILVAHWLDCQFHRRGAKC